jgi:SIR2-like domain
MSADVVATEISSEEPDTSPVMRRICEAVQQGQCILFLGAGVHHTPPDGSGWTYPEEARPLLGWELSERLAAECAAEGKTLPGETRNLGRTSLLYETTFKRNQLVTTIRDAVQTGKRSSPVLCGLADLNFPLVITTNFDQLLEDALTQSGKHPNVSVYNKDWVPTAQYAGTGDPTSGEPFVLKIHGDIGSPESIVITDQDYIHFILRISERSGPYDPIPSVFKFRLEVWPLLFIGYSLLDYNLRVLFEITRWRSDPANIRVSYSVDPTPDPLVAVVLNNVTFIVEDAWTFVPKLYRMVLGKEMPNRCSA